MTQIKNSAQKKKKCANTKTKVITTYNYCGEDLECSDIKKGDSIQTVIEKLNAVACNGAGREYTFEDSEQCENGGFDVYENDELIYTWCQECCGGGETIVVFNQLENQLLFDSAIGYPSSNQPPFIPNGISKFSSMDTLIPNSGTYIVTADFTMEYGGATPIGGSGVKTLYELRLDGVQVPYSTRFVKVNTGTPTNYLNTFTLTTEVIATSDNQTLELWFNSNTAETDNSLLVMSCSIKAIKIA